MSPAAHCSPIRTERRGHQSGVDRSDAGAGAECSLDDVPRTQLVALDEPCGQRRRTFGVEGCNNVPDPVSPRPAGRSGRSCRAQPRTVGSPTAPRTSGRLAVRLSAPRCARSGTPSCSAHPIARLLRRGRFVHRAAWPSSSPSAASGCRSRSLPTRHSGAVPWSNVHRALVVPDGHRSDEVATREAATTRSHVRSCSRCSRPGRPARGNPCRARRSSAHRRCRPRRGRRVARRTPGRRAGCP